MTSYGAKRVGGGLSVCMLVAVTTGCSHGKQPDAYGNFEATEVTVSAETAGQLLRFDVAEGQRLSVGADVALIDTTQLALQMRELEARHGSAIAKTRQAGAQTTALQVQFATAESELGRTQRLYRQQAATAQQLDKAAQEVKVLEAQLRAARQQALGSRQESEAIAAQVAQLQDRIRRSRIANPVTGTVLTTYAAVGEYVQPGQPLYCIANLDTLQLRAYVGETQLARIRIGEPAHVHVDHATGRLTLPGTVSWISSTAEFTPTPIQTREGRAELVYAVKVLVPNPTGILKIGMPADVRFAGHAGS